MSNCIINKTDNYIESVSIRPVEALPEHYELVIHSQWLDAKDPAALQVKYRTILSAAALRDLRDGLSEVIAR